MPTTVTEKYGRRLSAKDGVLIYLIEGTDDAGDARTALLAAAPATYESLDIDTDNVEVDEIEGYPDGGYTGTVPYRSEELNPPQPAGQLPLEAGETRFSFDTSGGTHRIKHAIAHVASYDSGGLISTFADGALNVEGEKNEPQGVDVPQRGFSFTVTKSFNVSSLTGAFLNTLFLLTGRANNANFSVTTPSGGTLTFGQRECLFAALRGSQNSSGLIDLDFSFIAYATESNIAIGPITVTTKLGWDHLYIIYQHAEDGTHAKIFPVPEFALVDQIVEEADFSALGTL